VFTTSVVLAALEKLPREWTARKMLIRIYIYMNNAKKAKFSIVVPLSNDYYFLTAQETRQKEMSAVNSF
jgi:hypothetical protein